MGEKKLYLKNKTLKHTETHSYPARPPYTATISLNPNTMKLTVTFRDPGSGSFNFPVGFIAKQKDGKKSIKKSTYPSNFSFGSIADNYGVMHHYGYGNTKTLTADLSKLKFSSDDYISITFLCQGCSPGWGNVDEPWQNNLVIKIYDARIPDPPKIVRTTGKTIRVTSGAGNLYCKTTSDGWYDQKNHTFTRLTQGTEYEFICKDDNGTKCKESVVGKTWDISGQLLANSVNSLTFKAKHTAGTRGYDKDKDNGKASDHKIRYELYPRQDTSSGRIGDAIEVENNTQVVFSNLAPGTTYYCYAYTVGLENNSGDAVIDNTCWIRGDTRGTASAGDGGGDTSATTLRVKLQWNSAGAKRTTCYFICNGVTKSTTTNNGYVVFTGLTPGVEYKVTYNLETVYDVVTETGPKEEKYNITNSDKPFKLTTKKASLHEYKTSSKIIQFSSYSNYSGDVMEQKLDNGSWYSVNQKTMHTHNNLVHNSGHDLYYRIKNCFAFDVSTGNPNKNNNDSEVKHNTKIYTKKLSLTGQVEEQHQHRLVTLWQAQVGGVNKDADDLDGYKFNFTSAITEAKKEAGYQYSEVKEGINGVTSGDYYNGHRIYSNDLTWYYCKYVVTATITDGFNNVSMSVIAYTTFPYSWIYRNGKWERVMPYVYTNNKWVPAPIFVYNQNKYIEPNGE